MGRGGEIALAVTMGYVLGRKRRMRWAVALGTAAAAGRLSSGRGGLVGKLSELGSSQGLGRLVKAGKPLVSAGGAAARTAVGGRIDSAADRLQQTALRLRSTGQADEDTDTDAEEDRPRASKRRAGGRDKPRAGQREAEQRDSDEPAEDDDQFEDEDDREGEPDGGEDYADDEGDEDEDEADEDEADGDDDEDDVKTRGRAETARPPVRRRGR